jgi:hypothetical protein
MAVVLADAFIMRFYFGGEKKVTLTQTTTTGLTLPTALFRTALKNEENDLFYDLKVGVNTSSKEA